MEKCDGVEPMNWKDNLGPDPLKHRVSPVGRYSLNSYYFENKLFIILHTQNLARLDLKQWFC